MVISERNDMSGTELKMKILDRKVNEIKDVSLENIVEYQHGIFQLYKAQQVAAFEGEIS